ncbi:MAG: mercuric reductase [Acidobacteriota bacterium]
MVRDEPVTPLVTPEDVHNAALVQNVHPLDWVNPEPRRRYHLVVLGAGTAGLVTAAGAAGLGARVALVERHLLGGDCLNVGCVPSKSIIRSSRLAGEMKQAAEFGLQAPGGVTADFGAVMARMRRIRARLSRNDSAERFRDLGVDVFLGDGVFTAPGEVMVGETVLRYRRAVIATGARAVRPDVEGLEEAGFLTNETVFSLTECPQRLAVIGGGPIGAELAQAFQRLGSAVTILTRGPRILPREDPQAAAIVSRAFEGDGIEMIPGAQLVQVRRETAGKVLVFEREGREESLEVDEILIGAGRAPNVAGLGLDTVGVNHDARQGVEVDDHLRTSNRAIYAAGDVAMRQKFTHAADFAARIVIQNSLFLGRARLGSLIIPRCTYTSPEVASVGLSETDAKRDAVGIDTFVRDMSEVDRAVADGEEAGFVKVIVRKGTGTIIGATIVAAHAGDLISEITLAMKEGIGLHKLAAVIHPYPTQAEAIRQIGDAFNRTRLTPRVKKIFCMWLKWMR